MHAEVSGCHVFAAQTLPAALAAILKRSIVPQLFNDSEMTRQPSSPMRFSLQGNGRAGRKSAQEKVLDDPKVKRPFHLPCIPQID